MGYINTIKINNDVLVWERNNGKRETVNYRAPYYFYTKSSTGEYTSMYGDKLERHDFATNKEFSAARAQKSGMGIELFESDIPAELKLLSKEYYNKPAPVLHVSLFDIEVDYDPARGFSSIEDPYAPINSIALYNSWQNRMLVLAVPPEDYDGSLDEKEILKAMHEISELPTDCEVEVKLFKNEHELLEYFLEEIQDSDVLSGWNSEYFDIPYLGKRLELMGKRYFDQLSFPEGNSPKFREVETKYRLQWVLDLSGRISADYMLIFKKYEVVERPTYRLEAIADEILIDPDTKESILPKLEYEGSLARLYRKNFIWFIRYNLRDTEILKGFEDRLGYIELANQMYHLSTGLFKHVTGTLKLSELATINYCHYEKDGLIVNDVHVPDVAEKAKGAFVLLPQIGEHSMIGAIDINSLYPAAIRSNNISPETIIGQFVEKELAFEEIKARSFRQLTLEMDSGERLTAGADEWREALLAKKWSVSGYGTVFSQQKQGIMPAILEYWYSMRKRYQKLHKEAKAAGDKIKATYYDKLQYVYKIKLNSYYGSLLNAYFRFYDKRLGESTTGTSRAILLHQCSKVCELLDGKYAATDRLEHDKKGKPHIGYSSKWSVIYGDTDSTYFKTHATSLEEAIEVADAVGEVVSASFPEFMRESFLCSEGFDDIIKTGREIVSDKGIFVDKKRYFLHIADDEGYRCDKIKVMGLDTKKTTLPKEVSHKKCYAYWVTKRRQ
jgi:DNA polymerase elongation subunit (family B)